MLPVTRQHDAQKLTIATARSAAHRQNIDTPRASVACIDASTFAPLSQAFRVHLIRVFKAYLFPLRQSAKRWKTSPKGDVRRKCCGSIVELEWEWKCRNSMLKPSSPNLMGWV